MRKMTIENVNIRFPIHKSIYPTSKVRALFGFSIGAEYSTICFHVYLHVKILVFKGYHYSGVKLVPI